MTGEKVKAVFQLYLDEFNRPERATANLRSKQMTEDDTRRFLDDLSWATKMSHLKFVCEEGQRLVDTGRIEKAMRWLGFIQGVLWASDVFTLDDLKNHSRPGQETTT